MANGTNKLTERQSNAVEELLEAFAREEQPGLQFLPFGFPRRLMQSPMPAVAGGEELEAAEKSLYGWWWRFLKESPEYPPKGKDRRNGPIASLYRDFGELGSDFEVWWQRKGRKVFGELAGTAVEVLYDSSDDGDDAPDTAEILIVRILMHVPREQIEEDLRLVLREHHPGAALAKELLRRGKRSLSLRKRRDEKALFNTLEVWKRARAQKTRNWMKIGRDLKLTAKDPTALSTRVRQYYEKAERLMKFAARGQFPKEYDDKDSDR